MAMHIASRAWRSAWARPLQCAKLNVSGFTYYDKNQRFEGFLDNLTKPPPTTATFFAVCSSSCTTFAAISAICTSEQNGALGTDKTSGHYL